MPAFKFDSQTFFLTYPQTSAEHAELIEALRLIADIAWARICTESHEDGQPHLHVVGKFTKRYQSRNPRLFDFRGRHPNIQPVRSIAKALDYVSKEGNYTDFGPVPVKQDKRDWAAIKAAAAGDEEEWLRVVHEERIPAHVAGRLRQLSESSQYDLDDYDNRPIADALSGLPTTIKSECIVGLPGIGKTGWAMLHMPRPCLLVKHIDCLRHFRPNYHKSIFFDDCNFSHLPRSTQLQICDFENKCQIHVRYGVAIIPKNTPRLFCCNYGSEPFIQDLAIQGRRVQYHFI